MSEPIAHLPPMPRGRGTGLNPANRFAAVHHETDPEASENRDVDPRTQFYVDATESLLTTNDSPDVGFEVGLNAYRGCEHGCSYCFARPYHEYLGWSSGIDFESKILVKLKAPEILRRELSRRSWKPRTIGMSGVTDCYQPAERRFRLTRGCLEVLAEMRNPVAILTKNFLVTRDIDLLSELAKWSCIAVNVSVTTLDPELAGKLEPRASRPEHRLEAIRRLTAAGVPVTVLVAPVIPGLNDHEIPAILSAAAESGARWARKTMLRLPWAVKDIFGAWLEAHVPGKKERVFSRLRDLRSGKLYDSRWGTRMRGEGIFAEQIDALFRVTARRAGLNQTELRMNPAHFRRVGAQAELELDAPPAGGA